MRNPANPNPLRLRSCAFTALATGEQASDLSELHDRILRVPGRSLYYHFWGRMLRPFLRPRDYVNDLGNWVGYKLRDHMLAERLAMIDPGDESDIETLRTRILHLLEERLADDAYLPRTSPEESFHFLEGQMVIFDTGREASDPAELAGLLPTLTSNTVYLHLIDARHRPTTGTDDFQRWLGAWGDRYDPLIEALRAVDVYFTSLPRLKEEVARLFDAHTGNARTGDEHTGEVVA